MARSESTAAAEYRPSRSNAAARLLSIVAMSSNEPFGDRLDETFAETLSGESTNESVDETLGETFAETLHDEPILTNAPDSGRRAVRPVLRTGEMTAAMGSRTAAMGSTAAAIGSTAEAVGSTPSFVAI